MHAFTSWPRPLLLTLAVAFGAATTLYSALWMYGVRVQPKTYLGVEAELDLESGDLLTVFSDGITEAFNGAGEEFGEHRLIEVLRGHRQLPVASLVDVVIRRVAEFSGSQQTDDQTLVVARVR